VITLEILEIVIYLLMPFFCIYGVYSLLFVFASFFPKKSDNSNFKPKVTVIIPCRNEEDVIETTLKSVHNQDYHDFEVIVVDDNSSDNTTQIVEAYIQKNNLTNFKLLKRTDVNSKKSKAVNFGVKHAKGDIIVFFDADNYPEISCITHLVKRFSNPKIAAVQGRITTNITQFVSKIVFMERCSGFNVRFPGRERMNLNCQFGGTGVAIRKKILKELGGFDEQSLTEDTHLTSKIVFHGYRVVYETKARITEEAPPNINNYISQRTRWAAGHMQCFLDHSVDIIKAPISLTDKIDYLLFLFYYFVPILCGIVIFFGLLNIRYNLTFTFLHPILSTILFMLFLAPIIEILVGVVRSKKKNIIPFIPSIIFFLILNIVICFNALLKIVKGENQWIKTERVQTKRKIGYDGGITIFTSVMISILIITSFASPLLYTQDMFSAEKNQTNCSDPTLNKIISGQNDTNKIVSPSIEFLPSQKTKTTTSGNITTKTNQSAFNNSVVPELGKNTATDLIENNSN